jgi:microcystin-dependent protein
MTHNPKFAIWCRAAAAIMLTWASGTFSAIAADGNPPNLMTYQSYLTDANGVALGNTAPKNYDVVFRIYNDQSATAAGNRLWTEQQTVTIDNGYFSVLLGEGSDVGSETRPAINSLFTGADVSDRFIEMTVKGLGAGGTDTTIKPRLRLMTSPYAFVAKHAINAANLVNSANTAVINASGSYVGINKLNPTAALDVVGGATVSGAITAGSAAISGGLSAGSATVTGTVSANALSATSASVSGTVTAGTFAGNGTIPVGGIIMWSGITAPTGWALCDGNNGTPDLRGRFVLGLGTGSGLSPRTLGTADGEENHSLTEDEMPKHTHALQLYWSGADDAGSDHRELENRIGTQGGNTTATGGNAAHNNMPPYYVLAYIMRVQ